MKMRTLSNKSKGVAVFVLSLVIALAGFSYASAEGAVGFPKNAMGLTYGTTVDPQTGELYETEPELRAVRASNGAEGYAYSADINGTLESLRSMNDEQREALASEKIEALIKASEECVGVRVFNEESAKDYLSRIKFSELKAEAMDDATRSAADCLKAAVSDGVMSDGDLEALAERDMLDEEFAVTFERLNRTAEAAAVSATVSEEAIEMIHRIARENTAIQIPVYQLDGITQIGTAPFYVM